MNREDRIRYAMEDVPQVPFSKGLRWGFRLGVLAIYLLAWWLTSHQAEAAAVVRAVARFFGGL